MSGQWGGRLRWCRTVVVFEAACIGMAYVFGWLSRGQALGWYIGCGIGTGVVIVVWWALDRLEDRRRVCGAVSPQWGFRCDQRVWRHKRHFHTAGLWRWSR